MVHTHGAHDFEDSDGYPEAWYLPLARNIPTGYATVGSKYYQFKEEARARAGVAWSSGMAQFAFNNDQRATSLWYHDHSLGMTRLSVISQFACGTVNSSGLPNPLSWDDPITEQPKHGSTELWQVWNFSPEGSAAISHVFHLHLVQFEVVGRQPIGGGAVSGPHPWELGRKDACASPTGYITSVKATFDHKRLFVWHCHLLDHEDNSMMRPMQVV